MSNTKEVKQVRSVCTNDIMSTLIYLESEIGEGNRVCKIGDLIKIRDLKTAARAASHKIFYRNVLALVVKSAFNNKSCKVHDFDTVSLKRATGVIR